MSIEPTETGDSAPRQASDGGRRPLPDTAIADVASLRSYCLRKAGASEGFPFDHRTLVFKVMGRMFALCGLYSAPLEVNLKCDPELAELLRGKYQSIVPGYHMNKRHWNTVTIDGTVPDAVLRELVDLSYELVVKGLTKADRDALQVPGAAAEEDPVENA